MMSRFQRLVATSVILLAAWFAVVAFGLLSGGYSQNDRQRVVLALLICILLACMILTMRTYCTCCNKRRRVRQPSPEGLAVGPSILILAAALMIAAMGDPLPALAPDTALLWLLGVVPGILATLLMLSGLVICWLRCNRGGQEPKNEDIPDRVWLLPDPWLYSQAWAQMTGGPVTWDNPSVSIFDPATGIEVAPWDLQANRPYRFMFEIQNGTTVTPAPVSARGTLLALELKEYGVGGGTAEWIVPPDAALVVPDIPRTPIAAGDAPSIVIVDHQFTLARSGHFCLSASLQHPDDANPFNNTGQHNLDVKQTGAGQQALFAIPIWNRDPAPRPAFPPKPSRVLLRFLKGVRALLAPLFWLWERPFVWLTRSTATDKSSTQPTDMVTLEVRPVQSRRGRELQAGWLSRLSEERIVSAVVQHDQPAPPHVVSLTVDVPANATPGQSAAFTVFALRGDRILGGVTCLTVVTEGGQ